MEKKSIFEKIYKVLLYHFRNSLKKKNTTTATKEKTSNTKTNMIKKKKRKLCFCFSTAYGSMRYLMTALI